MKMWSEHFDEPGVQGRLRGGGKAMRGGKAWNPTARIQISAPLWEPGQSFFPSHFHTLICEAEVV